MTTKADSKSVYQTLNEIDVSGLIDKKDGERFQAMYIGWANAWNQVKKIYPTAKRIVHRSEGEIPYFNDGKTAWVEVTVDIDGQQETDILAIMDNKFKSIKLQEVTSVDVSYAIQRCTVKCLALHGLGILLWTKEDKNYGADNGAKGSKVNPPASTDKRETLKLKTAKWDAALDYVRTNYKLGAEEIAKKMSGKYIVTKEILAEITKVVQEETARAAEANKVAEAEKGEGAK